MQLTAPRGALLISIILLRHAAPVIHLAPDPARQLPGVVVRDDSDAIRQHHASTAGRCEADSSPSRATRLVSDQDCTKPSTVRPPDCTNSIEPGSVYLELCAISPCSEFWKRIQAARRATTTSYNAGFIIEHPIRKTEID
jgi:hypothetical protein